MRTPGRVAGRTARVLLVAAALTGLPACASLRQPVDAALELESAAVGSDVAAAERLAPLDVYNVINSFRLMSMALDDCVPDIGGGTRCTFEPEGCRDPDDAVLTMHLQQAPDSTYRVTAAAITGVFRTVDDPDLGPLVEVYRCGLRGLYSEEQYDELDVFLASELYSGMLVPWPYPDSAATDADTALAMSRLATDRRAVGDAITALGRALELGEDTASVVTTAVVEAAFTMGLHVGTPHPIDAKQPAPRLTWSHDADAYPTDTAILRRGIELLDFAMQVPNAGVDWHQVPLLAGGGQDVVFTHTPSVAAMEEMNGIAHYLLGRAYATRAAQAPTCALWRTADEALTTGYDYLRNTPRDDQFDDTDARLASAADQATQQADTARLQACRTGEPS